MQGNSARFINHSCWPNCESKCVVIEGKPRIIIFAKRDIPAGDDPTARSWLIVSAVTIQRNDIIAARGDIITTFCNTVDTRRDITRVRRTQLIVVSEVPQLFRLNPDLLRGISIHARPPHPPHIIWIFDLHFS
jgi:hypothetical protein